VHRRGLNKRLAVISSQKAAGAILARLNITLVVFFQIIQSPCI
jgi:hypothetical protein